MMKSVECFVYCYVTQILTISEHSKYMKNTLLPCLSLESLERE